MSERGPLLILGLGNILCADDGLGVVAVHELERRYVAPAGAEVLDGGTLGLSLLPHVQDAGAVILVDAARTGDPPGSFVRLEGDDVGPAVRERLSPHQIGVEDLLQGARLLDSYPRKLVLLGLVPESIELRLGLSPALASRLDGLIESIVSEVRRLGCVFRPRGCHEADTRFTVDAVGALGL